MTPEKVLGQLLEAENEYKNNILLLKKVMLTAYLGRLRINDQPPDNQFSMYDYLFDEEKITFDFTRLTDKKKAKFTQWLLAKHQKEKSGFISNVDTNEYRGFTAEVALSWWGQLINWLFNKAQDKWQLADTAISIDYQLIGLNIYQGKKGMVIGFDQFYIPDSMNKYQESDTLQHDLLGNTKRVYLTDAIVDQLVNANLKKMQLNKLYKKPHPQSVIVNNQHKRLQAMSEYRQIQQFNFKPWYMLLLEWIISWFVEPESLQLTMKAEMETLLQIDNVSITKNTVTEEIIVIERRPDLDVAVFCGGGAKIFAHVGVLQALNELNIKTTRFSGSSAGAGMALCSYLGYSSKEILDFFMLFKQEHLIHYDIDRYGFSNSTAMQAAIDYLIIKKVHEIVTQYQVPHPKGLITFATLDTLRKQCSDCGLGADLVVTATNIRESQTRYFSLFRSPQSEVSEVVTASASLPPVYRPRLIEGVEHNDGGILNNFPTDAFRDEKSTLLEAENGNNLQLLAIQFDNGTERTTIDKIMQRVYKENFFLNGLYRLITGIKDPASGWEQDRIKLRQHALQSIIVNVGDISATQFNLTIEEKQKLVNNGYLATIDYVNTRYYDNGKSLENDELMYNTFSSLGDLLSYCCYRNQKKWFDIVYHLIEQSNDIYKQFLLEQAKLLSSLYFNKNTRKNSPGFFCKRSSSIVMKPPVSNLDKENYDYFRHIYPLFLALSKDLFIDTEAKILFEKIRHEFHLQSPLYGIAEEFAKIPGNTHMLFYITHLLVQELNTESCTDIYITINDLTKILSNNYKCISVDFFGKWNFTLKEIPEILNLFKSENFEELKILSAKLRVEEKSPIIKKTVYHKIEPYWLGRMML